MRIKNFIFILFIGSCFCKNHAICQTSYYPKDNRIYHQIDRLNNLYQVDSLVHHSAKQITRHEVFGILECKDSLDIKPRDKQLNKYYLQEGIIPKREGNLGFWKSLYYNPSHLFEIEQEDFNLVLNPVFYLNMGNDFSNDGFVFQNTRGLELYGQWDNKFYFYTSLTENQSRPAEYVEPFINKYFTIPGYGNYKDYQSSIIDAFNGYDHSNAKAYLGYRLSKHTNLELGHNKHFIGNGVRSLLLSDAGHNYFYLKFQLKIWKLQYQSIFAELASISARMNPGNELLPKKYMASHYLSFRPSRTLEIGLFEAVVFSRENIFELQYLNPLIIYRSIEHQLDSPDNVLLGINLAWNLMIGFSFYSQLIVDELRLSQLFGSEGWWGNKLGFQLGLKAFDIAGINQLDGQIEFNRVRPFTYSHWNPTKVAPELSVSNYSHYNQPLAHPLGANFSEIIIKLRYRFSPRFLLEGRYIYTMVGRNNADNQGGDILLVNTSRNSDFGNFMHQGAKSKISNLTLDVGYELFYNFHIEAKLMYRTDTNNQLVNYNNTILSLGIKYNFDQSKVDY